MADITMCRGENCRKRKSCYRFTAFVNPYRQSFFVENPRDPETKQCEYYWSNKDRKESKS